MDFRQHSQIKKYASDVAETIYKCSLPTFNKLAGNNINSAAFGKWEYELLRGTYPKMSSTYLVIVVNYIYKGHY